MFVVILRRAMLAGLLALMASSADAAPRIVKVTIAALSANFAPYFIPIDKGYYAEEGLTLEVTNAPGGVATPALLSGTVDISTSAASALSAIMRGAKLKILYTMSDRPTYQLWSTKPDLKTLKDLKGLSVGVQSRGDTFELAMRLTLHQAGLPGDWVGYTPLGFGNAAQAAIASGSLPAAVLSSADVDVLRTSGALGHGNMIADMFKDLRMPYSGIAVSDSLLRSDPDMLTRFLRATMKGVRYMEAFRDETVAIVLKRDPSLTRHAADLDYDDVVRTLRPDGIVSDDILRKDEEVRAEVLKIPADKLRPLSELYDYTLLRSVNAELDKSGWKPTR
jgi:NitT/TauT family transport system substrate-binding protein